MSWSIEGNYVENCSCNVVCPCTASLALGADNDRCHALLAFQIERGEIEGVDVSGVSVVAIGDAPKYMHEGGWRLGLLISDSASDEQVEKLGQVFGGQLGGPMEGLAPLVAENLGVERVPVEIRSDGGKHSVTLGDAGGVAVEDVVPFGVETGEPAHMTGIFHPVGSDLTISQATESKVSAFGIELENPGGSGFSAPFSWAA